MTVSRTIVMKFSSSAINIFNTVSSMEYNSTSLSTSHNIHLPQIGMLRQNIPSPCSSGHSRWATCTWNFLPDEWRGCRIIGWYVRLWVQCAMIVIENVCAQSLQTLASHSKLITKYHQRYNVAIMSMSYRSLYFVELVNHPSQCTCALGISYLVHAWGIAEILELTGSKGDYGSWIIPATSPWASIRRRGPNAMVGVVRCV